MQPYDECVFTKDRLRKYEGFAEMTDEELEKALMLMYIISSAYLTNRIKIEEYERTKFRQVQRLYEAEGKRTTGKEAA
jgi:hypothetical protein